MAEDAEHVAVDVDGFGDDDILKLRQSFAVHAREGGGVVRSRRLREEAVFRVTPRKRTVTGRTSSYSFRMREDLKQELLDYFRRADVSAAEFFEDALTRELDRRTTADRKKGNTNAEAGTEQ